MSSPQPSPHAEVITPSLTLAQINRLIYRWMWLFCLCFCAVFSLAIAYVMTATPIYRATAVVQVEQEEKRAYNPDERSDGSQDLKGEDILKTIEQNLQAPNLFVSVVSNPALAQDQRFLDGLNPKHEPLTSAELGERLENCTTVLLRRGTRLIDVSVEHSSPVIAQKVAQILVTTYINQSGQVQTSSSTSVEEHLQEVFSGIRDGLQKSENAFATYREALLLKDRISDQQRMVDALQQRYRDKHPTMIQAHALMADLTTKFDREVQKIRATSPSEASYWNDQDAVLNTLAPQDRIQEELKLVEARTNVLDGEMQTKKTLSNSVLKQMSEANVSKESAPTQVRVVEDPALPMRPVKPRRLIILVLGGAAGLVLGFALVFSLNAMDSSFKTSEEAEQYLRLPILGAIPQVSLRSKASAKRPARGAKPERILANMVLAADPESTVSFTPILPHCWLRS